MRTNICVCTRATVAGEVDINVWIFWALLLFASLFIVLRRRLWQRGDERAVEHEDLPHPIQVQDD